MPLKLVIANKAYSSWSLRPWLLMRVLMIPFDEIVVPLRMPDTSASIAAYNPAAKVPVLLEGDLAIWDSLAIIEFLAERNDRVWPADAAARAVARSLAAEMHAGFSALRRAYPMNMRRHAQPRRLDAETAAEVDANVARIEFAWADARQKFGHAGPFLFGTFSAADAMFAPIVNRFDAYGVPVSPASRAYMDAIAALPAWRDWRAGAEAEGWRVAAFDDLT